MSTRGLALAVLLALSALPVGSAYAYTSPGSPSGYVNDFAHILSPETVQSLNTELASFESSTSNEIAVVTVSSLGGDYLENYAAKLFAEWGIGKKDKDNGVLLLIAMEEREIRIEVGYGLEGALPDSVAQRIINNDISPLLKAGNYNSGVGAGVAAIEAATRGEYKSESGFVTWLDSLDNETFSDFALFAIVLIWQFCIYVLAPTRSWWLGGLISGSVGYAICYWLAIGFWSAGVTTLALVLFGLLVDYLLSGSYSRTKARTGKAPRWYGGFGSGKGGGGFGGFGGGGSGGGGASGHF